MIPTLLAHNQVRVMDSKKEERIEKEEEEELKDCVQDQNGHEEENAKGEEDDGQDTAVNEMEKTKVGIMRANVEKLDLSAKGVDDQTLRRFLRARDHDVGKASNMFLKYIKWRRSFMPNGPISASQISNELGQDKIFMQGFDKKGRPIILVFGSRHKQGSLEEFKRFVVYSLEKVCERMPRGQEKFVCIGDLEGWGYSNSDIRAYKASLSILQDCYPERLAKLYIVHVPYIFMTAWKVIYPFIDNKTKKKISFVEDKKLRSTLLTDIDETQLPDVYGGKLPLVPIQQEDSTT